MFWYISMNYLFDLLCLLLDSIKLKYKIHYQSRHKNPKWQKRIPVLNNAEKNG